MGRPTILITKKLASPAAFLAYGNKAPGETSAIHFIEEAFIRIEPVYDSATGEKILKAFDPQTETAVVFTSENAMEHIAEKIPAPLFANWRIFCIDGITRQLAADRFGADRIIGSAKYAEELAQCIVENGQFKKVLFFCGDKRRETIPTLLPAQGITVEEIIVYRTLPTPVKIRQPFEGIAFFSPSAVESFFSLNRLPEKAVCFAIGKTTAASIRTFTANQVIISSDTTEQQMIATIKHFFNQH